MAVRVKELWPIDAWRRQTGPSKPKQRKEEDASEQPERRPPQKERAVIVRVVF